MPLNCSASNLPSWEPRKKVAPAFCESKRFRLAPNIAPFGKIIERVSADSRDKKDCVMIPSSDNRFPKLSANRIFSTTHHW
jgi:hypothetical protein